MSARVPEEVPEIPRCGICRGPEYLHAVLCAAHDARTCLAVNCFHPYAGSVA